MKRSIGIGKNATGISMSPIDSKELVKYAANAPMPPGDEHDIEEARETFATETGVIGTVPRPASFKGLAKMALDSVKGKKATVFIDRLGRVSVTSDAGAHPNHITSSPGSSYDQNYELHSP